MIDEQGQRLRIRRLLMSAASSVVWSILLYAYAAAGVIPASAAHLFVALVVATYGLVALCFATGFNLRFADPSLAGLMMIATGFVLACLAYSTGPLRTLMLPFYVSAMFFGAFQLHTRELAFFAAYFVASYGGAIALGPNSVPAQEPTHMMLVGHLAFLMGVMAWIGGYVNRIRTRVRATNADLKQALQKIERIATQDELTGLQNRRSFNEMAAREKKRCDRNGVALCVAMVDADHFKRVNDRHGHATGDEVLRMLGRTLRGSLRETDTVGRYGGEEFVILMPETTQDNAARTLERVREKIRAAKVAGLDADERITVSIGIACYRHGEDIMQCVARADAALYDAKRTGRDRIVAEAGRDAAEPAMASVMSSKTPCAAAPCGQVVGVQDDRTLEQQPPRDAPAAQESMQRLRMRRHLMAALCAAAVVAVLYLYAAAGVASMAAVHAFAAAAALAAASFWVCFSTGINRRFSDPSLTGAQLAAAGSVLAYLAYAAAPLRALQLSFYMLALVFGTFRLGTRQLLLVGGYFVASYAVALMLGPGAALKGPAPANAVLVGHLALLMAVMAWIGGYVNRMRARLRATNVDLKQALQKIERIATQDELTGLQNRRSFNEMAAREKKRCDRNGVALCVAMVDADHFKRVNDRHGHATGDEVLRMLGRTLRGSLRETDTVGRYGGEEFVILMPETKRDNAVRTLETLRERIRTTEVAGLDADERITVSIGIACYRHGEDIMQCLARADAALYEAKRTGRDRIVCDDFERALGPASC